MTGKPELFYWDTGPLLAYLLDETRPGNEMDGVYEQMRRVDAMEAQLAISTIMRIEILETTLQKSQQDKFQLLIQRPNIHVYPVTYAIAEMAQEIRKRTYAMKPVDGFPEVDVPDSIHLATAIWARCDKFLTFDGKSKAAGTAKAKRGLLPLNPWKQAGHQIIICKPEPPLQAALGL